MWKSERRRRWECSRSAEMLEQLIMNLNVFTFSDYWRQNYPDCPPVSYLFKWRLADRWFRFHSLPESKRYAESQTEVSELLARHNVVLLDVIGKGGECVLVASSYAESNGMVDVSGCPELSNLLVHQLPALPKQEFDPEPQEEGEPPIYLRLACGNHILQIGSLDEVLLCVADCRVTNFFVISSKHQRIFAPYDGGVDVVLRDATERDEFKARYEAWLSKHSDGL